MDNPNKPLILTLHPSELDYIARCLHRQPYGDVAPLLAKIQNQIINQPSDEPELSFEHPVDPAVSAPGG